VFFPRPTVVFVLVLFFVFVVVLFFVVVVVVLLFCVVSCFFGVFLWWFFARFSFVSVLQLFFIPASRVGSLCRGTERQTRA